MNETPNSDIPAADPIIYTPNGPNPPVAPGSNKALWALILGIFSLICCGFFTGIPAIILGRMELNAISKKLSPDTNKSMATIGFILGIVGTLLACLSLLSLFLIPGLLGLFNSQTPLQNYF